MTNKQPWWLALGSSLADALEQPTPVPEPTPQVVVPTESVPAGPVAPQARAPRPESPPPAPSATAPSVVAEEARSGRSHEPPPSVQTCDGCRHRRQPVSLVGQAQELMPMRTMANSEAVNRAEQAELSRSGDELRSWAGYVNDALANPSGIPSAAGHGRPVTHPYCGEHEMEGRFEYLEVKNAELDCDHYSAGPIADRPCETCAEYRAPTAELLLRLQGPFSRAGQTATQIFTDQIREPLRRRADLELEEVVRTQGYVTDRPAHFPFCALEWAPGMHAVGPLLNQGKQCPRWHPSTDTGQAPEEQWQVALRDAELVRHRLEVFNANAPTGGAARIVWMEISWQRDALEKAAREAEAPFVRAALEALGFTELESASLSDQFTVAQEAHRMAPTKF